MSSPTLNQSAFVVDRITQDISETREHTGETVADSILTARAVFAVTLLGAGCWYALWKMALYFLNAH